MRVRVRFDPPGFHAVDANLLVELDGAPIHDGSFLSGFTRDLDLEPGVHQLASTIRIGLARRREWSFEVPEVVPAGSALVVRPTYSRFWGNFAAALSVTTVDAASLAGDPGSSEPADDGRPAKQPVIATWVMLAILAAVLAAEIALGLGPELELSPSVPTLLALGGLAPPSLAGTLWPRVIACTFLHASVFHLLMNAVALLMAGVIVESIVGWRWLLALYFVAGLGGSAVSLALNDGTLVSVGASGAIMGLFAAGLFLVRTLPVARRGPLQFQLLRVLVPSLLPILPVAGARVDVGAHLGGAVAGAIAGALLLALLRASAAHASRVPFERSPIASALAGAFVLASVVSLAGVVTVAYPEGHARALLAHSLLPDAELPQDERGPSDESLAGWLDRYPDDPRVHLFAAQRASEREEWPDVDAHLARARAALARYVGVFPESSRAIIEGGIASVESDSAVRRELLSNRELPTGTPEEVAAAWSAHIDAWVGRHPNDPRVLERAAWDALDDGDFVSAERHARRALEQSPRFAPYFPDGALSLQWLRAALALSLVGLDRGREAAPMIESLCRGDEGPDVTAFVVERGLCETD